MGQANDDRAGDEKVGEFGLVFGYNKIEQSLFSRGKVIIVLLCLISVSGL